ncbi:MULTISPECIES: toll/interleukin-1 receptor domain-containing protein [unclassified Bradyrhizobium]|uniref:toll/interleukin-1 receptor domain-containing protein n=1 Tax=unclassified Bradyrhizobium TaxID=2631580 RepID=UPI0028F13292|nr:MULTISPECIES: toll/interleukin-1 receptor domain-containing protein [unclassified Bradyrhizobium]
MADKGIESYDVFISHASEDKAAFVKPLADFLKEVGAAVWYDEFTLSVGDSLSRSIDRGLAKSRFGVVVLSRAFLGKRWPEYELRGLVAKEMEADKVILPVWLGVSKADILAFSPPLADKLAISATGLSVESVGDKLLQVIRPDLSERIHRRLAEVNLLTTARKQRVDPKKLKPSPFRHLRLSSELLSRVRLIRAALLEVHPLSMEAWIDGFRRDTNPDREIAIWERIASTYLECAHSSAPSERQKIFEEVFSLIGLGIKQGVSEEIIHRCSSDRPIEGSEVERYPAEVFQSDDAELSISENLVADVVRQDTVERLRLDELKTLVAVNSAVRVDVSELSQSGVRELLAGCDVILGEDRNTGVHAVFYGKEVFEAFAKRKEPGLVFPRPVMIISYDNSSDELEQIAALVQYTKGACCYSVATRKRSMRTEAKKGLVALKRKASRSTKSSSD